MNSNNDERGCGAVDQDAFEKVVRTTFRRRA